MSFHSKRLSAPNKAEKAQHASIRERGCVCCWIRMLGLMPCEVHHLLIGGMTTSHLNTIGLCIWHHRGRLMTDGRDHRWHREFYGPSLAEGSKPFHLAFGSDAELLDFQNRLLAA